MPILHKRNLKDSLYTYSGLVNRLFISILLMLLPISIWVVFSSSRSTILTIIMYATSTVLMLQWIGNSGINIDKQTLVICFILSFIHILPVVTNYIIGIDSSLQDIPNAVIVPINAIIYWGFMRHIKVSKKDLNRFMILMLWLTMFACLFNIVKNYNSMSRVLSITSSYEVNFRSIFANRNQFGGFIFISIVAHSYYLADNPFHFWNIVVFLLQILNLILSMSRSALLATTIFGLILAFQLIKKAFTAWLSILIVTLITMYIFTSKYSGFLFDMVLRINAGTSGRDEIWTHGLVMASRNILNGVGLFTSLKLLQFRGIIFTQYHNMFLETLVSTGILGLLALFYLLLNAFYRCCKSKFNMLYIKIYMASFFALLVLGSFESVSFFSIGYVDTLFTIFFVSVPLLISNIDEITGLKEKPHTL